MVSGTRCPALSDELKKWSKSRAAAPKDQCPLGHRGKFPDFLKGHFGGLIWFLLGQIWGIQRLTWSVISELIWCMRADSRPERAIWRQDWSQKGQIWGLRGQILDKRWLTTIWIKKRCTYLFIDKIHIKIISNYFWKRYFKRFSNFLLI